MCWIQLQTRHADHGSRTADAGNESIALYRHQISWMALAAAGASLSTSSADCPRSAQALGQAHRVAQRLATKAKSATPPMRSPLGSGSGTGAGYST